MSLKTWLIAEVEPICEAEPAVLADYILALLKHDLPPADLKKLFIAQLEDFLRDETPAFVDKLFKHISARPGPSQPARGVKRGSDAVELGPPDKIQRMDVDGQANGVPPGKKEELCRDYHHRGYCARGDQCQYLHDERPDLTANLYANGGPPAMHHPQAPFAEPQMMHGGSPGFGRGRGRGGHRGGPPPPPFQMQGGFGAQGRRGRFDMRPRSQDTLVVENIPVEHLTFDAVSTFFRKFGNITNLTLDQAGMKALISFATPQEAKAAHVSPDPVFGNRFVRIFFQRLDEPVVPGAPPQQQTPPPSARAEADAKAAAALERAAAIRKAATEQMEAKQKLQTELDEKIAAQKALLGQLEGSSSMSASEKSAYMKQLREAANAVDAARKAVLEVTPAQAVEEASRSASPAASMDENRAKLEALRAEAAALGIDPSAPEAGPSMRFSRGRGRGRARARGRGFAPRGRGFPRGGAASFASRSLDLRPKKLVFSGLSGESDLQGLKEQATILDATFELEGTDGCSIAFKSRNEAERFLAKGTDNLPVANKEAVRMRWSAEPVAAPAGNGEVSDFATDDAEMQHEEDEVEEDEETSWKR